MTELVEGALRRRLDACIGRPLSASGLSVAPDAVNVPMIRHWVDALDDRNPVYLDGDVAAKTRFGDIVAPPAMLQTWTMARPQIAGIAERGGAATEVSAESALGVLAGAGYTATLATDSELEFFRYLRVGDLLSSATGLEAVSDEKMTALGSGYFVTWVTNYTDSDDNLVGRQRFRVFRFMPGSPTKPKSTAAGSGEAGSKPSSVNRPVQQHDRGADLPPFALDVTPTVVVAGAIASRDFMPAHHDRDYARSQGAPDIFMNILTTNGYVSRYVTDWAGPEAMVRSISIRLGAPAIPGRELRFTGSIRSEGRQENDRLLDVTIRAANDLGDHAAGSVVMTLPNPT